MRTDPLLLFELLLLSFSLGVGVGVGRDLALFLSRIVFHIRPISHKPRPTAQPFCQALGDLVFCFATGSSLSIILFYYNDGILRGFAMIALLIGFLVYRNSLGRWLVCLSARYSQTLGHGIYLGFSYVIAPIFRFLNWILRMIAKPVRVCRKKISERRIQKYNITRTEQLRKISKEGFVNI